METKFEVVTSVNDQVHFRLKDTTIASIHITPDYIYIRSPQQQGARWITSITLWDFDITYFYG